jgi:hypothetical protein
LVAEGSATNGSAQLTEGNVTGGNATPTPTPQPSGRHLNFQCLQLQRRKIQNKIDSTKEMTMHVTMGKWKLNPSRTI